MIAAKNHKNGVGNPYAQMRKDLGFEFCRTESEKNPFVAGPLKRTDCSLVSDGAAALVIADTETALRHESARSPSARRRTRRTSCRCRSATSSSSKAAPKPGGERWRRPASRLRTSPSSRPTTASPSPNSSSTRPWALRLKDRAPSPIKEGWTQKDGKLPVNPSGGLKAKGHPIGATGVSMHALSAMQLCEEAGDIQVRSPKLGGIFNMGGAAVANYVSVLERIK